MTSHWAEAIGSPTDWLRLLAIGMITFVLFRPVSSLLAEPPASAADGAGLGFEFGQQLLQSLGLSRLGQRKHRADLAAAIDREDAGRMGLLVQGHEELPSGHLAQIGNVAGQERPEFGIGLEVRGTARSSAAGVSLLGSLVRLTNRHVAVAPRRLQCGECLVESPADAGTIGKEETGDPHLTARRESNGLPF